MTSSSAATRGQHVLGIGRRGRHDMTEFLRQLHDQRGGRFRQPVAKARILGAKHLRNTLDFRRLGRGIRRPGAGAEHGDVAQTLAGRHRLGGRIDGKLAIRHFAQKKNRHQITPASSFSFAISSSTEPTLMPALRPCGSTVFTTVRRGVTSTP